MGINDTREEWARWFGMTGFVHLKSVGKVAKTLAQVLDGGADYGFIAREISRSCDWGTSIVIGVAEAGKEISTRPYPLVTGRY